MVRLPATVLVRTERLPFGIGEEVGQPQSRQYDHAAGHPCDPRDQCGDGRRRGRDSGRNRETGWWLLLPTIRELAQQPVAPLGEVDKPPVSEDCRPLLSDQLQLL